MSHWRRKTKRLVLPKYFPSVNNCPQDLSFLRLVFNSVWFCMDCGGRLSLSRLNVLMACWTNGRAPCLLKSNPLELHRAQTSPAYIYTPWLQASDIQVFDILVLDIQVLDIKVLDKKVLDIQILDILLGYHTLDTSETLDFTVTYTIIHITSWIQWHTSFSLTPCTKQIQPKGLHSNAELQAHVHENMM